MASGRSEQKEEVAAFWKKRRKKFLGFRPEAAKPARPKRAKFFCCFYSQK
jgi:hypothetical protein